MRSAVTDAGELEPDKGSTIITSHKLYMNTMSGCVHSRHETVTLATFSTGQTFNLLNVRK